MSISRDISEKAYRRKSRETIDISPGSGELLRAIVAFPAQYRIAMANLGFQLVYAAFNRVPGVCCHRAFYPDREDVHQYISGRIRLTSFESSEPVSNYDVMGVSINYENDVPQFVRMMHFAGIPVRAESRTHRHPLVIAGGVVPTVNPEPLAGFVDIVVLGEGEDVIPELLDVLKWTYSTHRHRQDALVAVSRIPGIYVPSHYRAVYGSRGEFVAMEYRSAGRPPELVRRIAKNLDVHICATRIATPENEFKNLHLVEVSRGCPHACGFCLIPGCYGAYRARSKESILRDAGRAVPGNRIGLLGAGAGDHPELVDICTELAALDFRFSFSSLRPKSVTNALASLIGRYGPDTITFAPEAGSERRRKKLGKILSDGEILAAVGRLRTTGVRTIKLYFIVGLPGESDADLEAIPAFVRNIVHEISSRWKARASRPRVTASVSCFVPKPLSPFERAKMMPESELKARIQWLKRAFRKLGNVRFFHDVPQWAVVQGVIARGDRRVSDLIESVAVGGKSWREALRTSPVNPGYYLYRHRPLHETLPWHHIRRNA